MLMLTFVRASLPSLCKSNPLLNPVPFLHLSFRDYPLCPSLTPLSLSHSPPLPAFACPIVPFISQPSLSLVCSVYLYTHSSLYFCILYNKYLNNNGTMGHTSNTPLRLQVTPISGFKTLSHSQSPHFGTAYTSLHTSHIPTQPCASFTIPHNTALRT